jgi:seryl-tRNA synthetase
MIRSFIRRYSATVPPSELPAPRLDYRALSDNITSKSLNALNRKAPIPSDTLPALARTYAEWKRLGVELNQKRNRRSLLGDRIRNGLALQQEKQATLEEAASLKSDVKSLEATLSSLETLLLNLALPIPNDTHPSSPLGPQSAATVVYQSPPSTLLPADPARDHLKLATHLSLIDLKSGATTTGHAWYFLQNEGALLELALTNYALSLAMKRGYAPVIAPDVVRSDIASRCGFQPRESGEHAAAHMYHIAPSSPELVLSGTAEIPLAAMSANKVLPASALPLKLVGMSHAFRAEAGARSADTRGLYRVHQFTKVELLVVCQGEGDGEKVKGSEEIMEEMLELQREVLDGLKISYR